MDVLIRTRNYVIKMSHHYFFNDTQFGKENTVKAGEGTNQR